MTGLPSDEQTPAHDLQSATHNTPSRHPRLLLALGACAGLACAVTGILATASSTTDLSPDVVALINGEPVRRDTYLRAVAALASDRRTPIDEAEQRYVLERLVDEELLVQRALELGLARRDRRVRGELVSAVIQSVTSEAVGQEPSAEDLKQFYLEDRDYFTQPGRLRVQRIVMHAEPGGSAEESRARARRAAERLRMGESFSVVRDDLGDAEVAPLPDGFLPPGKLREYVGPTALRTVMELQPGEVSDPVRSPAGYQVFQLMDREPQRVPPLGEIEAQVRSEFQRRTDDRALRAYLDTLKERAHIRIATSLPSLR